MKRKHDFYRVTRFRNKRKTIAIMNGDELSKIKPNGYDAIIDKRQGEYIFNASDDKLHFLQQIPKIGVARWLLFLTLLREPGKPWTAFEIGSFSERYVPKDINSDMYKAMRRTVDSLYISENLRCGLYLWRKALRENKNKPHFFLSQKPLAIAWNPARSFLLIEPIIEGLEDICYG